MTDKAIEKFGNDLEELLGKTIDDDIAHQAVINSACGVLGAFLLAEATVASMLRNSVKREIHEKNTENDNNNR